jgi:hypothetical protein
VELIANVELLKYEEGVPNAFEGANAGDDSDFTTELARTWSCGETRLNLG